MYLRMLWRRNSRKANPGYISIFEAFSIEAANTSRGFVRTYFLVLHGRHDTAVLVGGLVTLAAGPLMRNLCWKF